MEARWWLMVLAVCCVAAGQVWGCCGDPDDPSPRVERSAGRHWQRRFRNGTGVGRWGIVKRALRRIPLHRLKEIQDMDLGSLLRTLQGASHPEFVSFIANSNVSRPTATVTGMGVGRPTLKGSRQSALHKDLQGVASERRSVIKDAGCKPRKVPVLVPLPEDPLLLYTPSCVLIPRCSGCCGHELLECVPTEVKNIRKKVLALRFSEEDSISLADEESSIKKIKMEKHVKCECQCKIKESTCNARQVYDAANCRCLCENEHEASSCPGTKIWSEADCMCKCAKVDECSTGLEFDPIQCRCLPSSTSRSPLFGAVTQAPSSSYSSSGGSAAATPAVPNRRDTADRHDTQNSPAVTDGTMSSGWGTASSSGVIEDRPPPSRSRPAQPSRTYSRYQTASPYQRYDQTDAGSRHDRRYDQTSVTSRNDRRYDRTNAASGHDRRYDQQGASSRYPDRRYQPSSYPSHYADRRYEQSRQRPPYGR